MKGVLVHGFHLQAENWQKIAWGEPPDLLGKVPAGVLAALEEKAKIMVFGTGASEKDGKKEAEYTRDYLLEHFLELAEFSAFRRINLNLAKFRKKIILETEIRSQNTAQEIRFAGEIFKEYGAEKIILVSSPAHVSRCLRDGLAILKGQNISVRPSQTSFEDASEVIIIEPQHRPDQPKSNLHSFVRKLMEMSKEEQEKVIKKALA